MNLSSLAYNIAPFIGVTTLGIGISAVAWPLQMSKKFGVAAAEPAAPYVISTGIRDVFMGLVVLLLWHAQQWELLGATNLCIAIVAISDCLVVRKHGDRRVSFVHLAGAIAVTGYGAWLVWR